MTGSSDPCLLIVVLAMMVWGVVVIYSASGPIAIKEHHSDGAYFLARQVVFVALGLGVMIGLAHVDYHYAGRFAHVLLVISLVSMIALLVGFGHTVNGATRWLALPFVQPQPAEFAKFVMLIWLASSLSKKSGRLDDFWVAFLPHVLVAGVFSALCIGQRDCGSAVFVMAMTLVMQSVAGTKPWPLLVASAVALPIGGMLVAFWPYRVMRDIVGPYDSAFKLDSKASGGTQIWSPCNADRNINLVTRIRLQNSTPRRDGRVTAKKAVVRLVVRSCPK